MKSLCLFECPKSLKSFRTESCYAEAYNKPINALRWDTYSQAPSRFTPNSSQRIFAPKRGVRLLT